jgi:hypothetical protein
MPPFRCSSLSVFILLIISISKYQCQLCFLLAKMNEKMCVGNKSACKLQPTTNFLGAFPWLCCHVIRHAVLTGHSPQLQSVRHEAGFSFLSFLRCSRASRATRPSRAEQKRLRRPLASCQFQLYVCWPEAFNELASREDGSAG